MTDNLKHEIFLTNDKPPPRIYVACLASYVAGKLFGKWINATQPVEDILAQIKQLLANSPMPNAEEFAIHDYEGFYSLEIDEYESITNVHNKAVFISEHGALGVELIVYYAGNLEDAKTALEDHYQGEYQSELDFATYLFEEIYLHDIPEPARYYVDYEGFKKDIFINDYFSIEVQGRYHIFEYH